MFLYWRKSEFKMYATPYLDWQIGWIVCKYIILFPKFFLNSALINSIETFQSPLKHI